MHENGAVKAAPLPTIFASLNVLPFIFYLALWPFLSKLREASSAGRPMLW
jgi:hypothetical protein